MTDLTPRQTMLLHLLAKGMDDRGIAFVMQIEERTLRGLVTTLLEKCGLHSRSQCAEYLRQKDES